MDVVYVGPVPPLRGGIAQHGARLVEALRGAGHRVDVWSWAAQYPARLYPGEARDPEAEPLPGARFSLSWWNPWSWWRAGRAARRADLLVFPWVTPFQGPIYRVVSLAAGRTPSVVVAHNPVPHEPRRADRFLTRLGLGGVRGAVVHAAEAAADLDGVVPGVESRTVPLPPLVSIEARALPEAPPYRLLFLGFVRPYKGLDVAIDALAELHRREVDATLTVAGMFWGPVDPWVERIEAAGLADAVALRAEYVPDAEVDELLATHHLVVAPYRSATQSAIVPLACAAGRPIVATTVGGLPEVVMEGETGCLAPPGDPVAFADAVERALGSLEHLAVGAGASGTTWDEVATAVIEAAG